MTPGLQAFAERDAGFRQFNDRYETVSADPETRREYAMWFDEALRLEGMLDWARQEGRDEVESKLINAEQRLEEAERKRKDDLEDAERKRKDDLEEAERKRKAEFLSAARVMKSRGVSHDIIVEAYPSLASEIEEM